MLTAIKKTPYSIAEWTCMKVSLSLLMLIQLYKLFPLYSSAPNPAGICRFFDCAMVLGAGGGKVIVTIVCLLLVAYIFEKKMLYTTFALGLFCLMKFSLEESNGVLNRGGIFTAIFLVQFLAYLLYRIGKIGDPIKYSVIFAIQVIAAGYTLSALSKLSTSGLQWIADGTNVSLQILKSFYGAYFDTGNYDSVTEGTTMVSFITDHIILLKFLFGFSLAFELFCAVALINKKIAFVYGLLLTGMHVGIKIIMNILIVSISGPMLVFFVNPLYWVYIFITKAFKGLQRLIAP